MCRMIGVIARQPVPAGPYLDALIRQARGGVNSPHADGCGIAILRDGHWLHVREQCPMWESSLEQYRTVSGTAMILHARLASPGTPINLGKLHPFYHPDPAPGVMFCQNGTIKWPESMRADGDESMIDTDRK